MKVQFFITTTPGEDLSPQYIQQGLLNLNDSRQVGTQKKIKINLYNNTYWSTIDLFAFAQPEGVEYDEVRTHASSNIGL